jgi:hypothetical protein
LEAPTRALLEVAAAADHVTEEISTFSLLVILVLVNLRSSRWVSFPFQIISLINGFLQYVHKIAPRGVYTSGKGSSAVGLTAYVTRDPDSKQLVLERLVNLCDICDLYH